MAKKISPQPFSYQQFYSSCWITSMFNALVYVLGSAEKVKNATGRRIFAISSDGGTWNEEARMLAPLIGYYCKVPCDIFDKEDVNKESVRYHLAKGAVLVCDTEYGNHTVLITGIKDDRLQIFDPDWLGMNELTKAQKKRWKVDLEARHVNAQVSLEEFLKIKGATLRMGRLKDRFMVVVGPARKRRSA